MSMQKSDSETIERYKQLALSYADFWRHVSQCDSCAQNYSKMVTHWCNIGKIEETKDNLTMSAS